VRSTALRGEVLTRLDQSGNKKVTHVAAEGLLFATQRVIPGYGADVLTTYRNPLGTTETNKAVYDPLGNYIPYQVWHDPRPAPGSYNSGSMAQLSASQANPESMAVGCIMDGVPTNCSRVIGAIGNGQADKVSIYGFALSAWMIQLQASFLEVKTTREVPDKRRLPPTGVYYDDDGNPYPAHGLPTKNVIEVSVAYVIAPGMQLDFEQNPQKSRVGSEDLKAYRARIEEMLKNKKCADYIQRLLNEVKTQTGRSFGEILTTFDAVRFYWANTDGAHGGYAYWEEMGTVHAADIMNRVNTEKMGGSRANQMDRRAFLISETTQAFLGETMHHLSQGGRMYGDGEMANALNAVLVRQGLDTPKVFSDQTDTDLENASRYWHPKVASACPAPRR